MLTITLTDFIRYSMGEIYALAPKYNPRHVDEILQGIIENFKKDCKHVGSDFFCHDVEIQDLPEFVAGILSPIQKFRDLNLSSNEYQQGISVDDENRTQFAFISRYNTISEDDDFIDLDACIRNIAEQLYYSEFTSFLLDKLDNNASSELRIYKDEFDNSYIWRRRKL